MHEKEQKTIKRSEKGTFIKGHSPNPGGLTVESAELKHFVGENRLKVSKLFHLTGKNSVSELESIVENPVSTAIEAITAKFYLRAIEGSFPHAQEVLNRLMGAVPKAVVTQDADGETKPMTIQVNTDKLLAVMMQLNQLPDDDRCDLIPDITNG